MLKNDIALNIFKYCYFSDKHRGVVNCLTPVLNIFYFLVISYLTSIFFPLNKINVFQLHMINCFVSDNSWCLAAWMSCLLHYSMLHAVSRVSIAPRQCRHLQLVLSSVICYYLLHCLSTCRNEMKCSFNVHFMHICIG